MIAYPVGGMPDSVPAFWQQEYVRLLDQRLDRSLAYLRVTPAAEQRAHVHSFLSLLGETHRYPELTTKALEFIAALHPFPVRWESTYAWEPELRFALEHTPRENLAQRAEYRCALGDLLLFDGRFGEAIEQSRIILSIPGVPEVLVARAGRIAFQSYRFSGRAADAEHLLCQARTRFLADQACSEVPPELLDAWLVWNQSRLEILREKGKADEAYALANEMIALDRRLGMPDPIRTADLLTQRSTLLWSRSHYQEAIEDLNACIALYREAGDILNSESRESNLGLVYWLMGDLNQAEIHLAAAMRLYQRIGLDQMLTYASGNMGLVLFCRGDLDGATKFIQEQISRAQELNYLRETNRGLWNLALLEYYRGNITDLKEVYDSTLGYYSDRGNNDVLFLHVSWMALYYEKLGHHEKALALATEAVRVGQDRDLPLLEQIAQRCLACLLPPAERDASLRRSLDLATAAGRKFEITATWLMIAGAAGDPEERQKAWKTGVEMLRDLGAEKWLEGCSMDRPPFLPLFI